jgi:hypothetical protein
MVQGCNCHARRGCEHAAALLVIDAGNMFGASLDADDIRALFA